MQKYAVFLAILAFFILGSATVFYTLHTHSDVQQDTLAEKQDREDYRRAAQLLDQSQPLEALEIIKKHTTEIEKNLPQGKKWLDLFIRTSEATMDIPQLVVLYEYYPYSFENHEKASLYVADAFILAGRGKDYQQIREEWKGKEQLKDIWFILDADKLLLDGRRNEAIGWLKSKKLEKSHDTGRLTRLALLTVSENPKEAWSFLNEAFNQDPSNPDIRLYRARLLESLGEKQFALSEYVAAADLAPSNLYLKDQIAEYFLRQKNYGEALNVWTKILEKPALDFIWLKAFFWNKVYASLKYDWKPIPQGKFQPLIEYLASLEPESFWNAKKYESIPNGKQYLQTEQMTYWLRLFQALKDKDEKEALSLLTYNPFTTVSWAPNLEIALKRILQYRKSGSIILDPSSSPIIAKNSKENDEEKLPTFFKELEKLAKEGETENNKQLPDDIKSLLSSPEVFTIALLSEGWNEAALQLHTIEVYPETFPQWAVIGMTEAFKVNKGNIKALEFATMQKQTPELSFLIGETLISEGNVEAGLDLLDKIAKENNDAGVKATLLISNLFIKQEKYDKAKEIVQANPRLFEETQGKELLARIAVLEGNSVLAEKMYKGIEDKSIEAKSFFAKKAFEERDWKRAEELTKELLKQYPNNPLLLDNLKKIEAEATKKEEGHTPSV